MGSPASMVETETVPVGYRFHPTDEELVGHYLKHKLLGDHSRLHNTIAEIDVCKFEPWDLPAFSKVKSDDPEWFFFSPVGFKYKKSDRCNRKTKAGYWKITGKDRKIKTRGTNNVIGTKKTLVFYKGRSPLGVKTNWVIHEYHAVTFPNDKRGFVLCRLMKKAEKKARGGTDALIHDEGQPSSRIAADYENQATADRIPDVCTSPEVNVESNILAPSQAEEYDFPSLQPSPIVMQQGPYFLGSAFPNAFFGDEKSIMQFLFETTEEEDNVDYLFLKPFLTGEDVFIGEETTPAFVNDSTPSQSWRKVYYKSSETDAELLSARHGNILDTTSSVCNEHTGSRENPILPTVKSSHDAVYAGRPPVSSKNVVNLEKKDSTIDDDFWGDDAFGDSTAIAPLSIFHIQSVSSPSPPRARSPSPSRRWKSKYHPRSHNYVSQRTSARRSQAHRTISSQAVSQQEEQKETYILESNKEQRKAQGTSSRKNLETTSDQSSGVNGKGSFIYSETPLSVNLLQHGNILDTTSSACNEHPGSRENLVISMVKSAHDAVYADPPPLSSKNEVNLEKKDSTSDDDFWEVYTYGDSTANRPLSICVIRRPSPPSSLSSSSPSPPRASSPSPSGRCQSKYLLRSHNFVSLRAAARRSQTHRKISSQVVSQQEVLKETRILESNKEQRKAQGTSSRKKLEATSNQSSGINGKGSFIYLETPLVQRSWLFFTWSCASSWHGFEFDHDMMHKLKLEGVSQ